MTAYVVRAGAEHLPLPDVSVDLVCTSPPYFGLRSYQDDGKHYDGQVGSEATPAEFLDVLVRCTAEWMRVLKPSGSIWVNLGDGYQDKGLRGLPWRYAIRCIDELGLILRAEVVWSKPNGLPESVTDRVRRSHEQWFHFTKLPRYYSAVDAIREEQATAGRKGERRSYPPGSASSMLDGEHQRMTGSFAGLPLNPLGKLPGSVWTIGGGDTTLRVILDAIAGGHLTPDEGERILWAGRTNSGPMSTSPETAGGGSASSTATATDATGTPSKATDEHTDSSTSSRSAPSPMDSPSTTSAVTHGASTQATSNQSPSASTADADLAQPSAPRDTSTTSGTLTSDAMASGSAEPAWSAERGSIADAPPSVWVVPTEPLSLPDVSPLDGRPLPDHFAAFPMEWPRRIVRGWSPREVCTVCREGRRPVVERESNASVWRDLPLKPKDVGRSRSQGHEAAEQHAKSTGLSRPGWRKNPTAQDRVTGYDCACPDTTEPATPGVVLDPFGGTGTVALMAHALGRVGVSVDYSHDYSRVARYRTTDRSQLAKAMQVEKPEPVMDGQTDLFGESA